MTEGLSSYDVSRAYWILPPADRSWSAVAKKLGRPDTKVEWNRLARVARAWEESGFVRHVVTKKTDVRGVYPERVLELEYELSLRYGLRAAVVVESPLDDGRFDDRFQLDNVLHEHLGSWAARLLLVIVRPGDVVAVGSGRGPYFATQRLGEFVPCLNRPLHPPKVVRSLTGFMGVTNWPASPGGARPRMDADDVAILLSGILSARLPPERLGRPVVDSEEKVREATKSEHFRELGTTNVALLSLGSIRPGGGHSYVANPDFVRKLGEPEGDEPHLLAAARSLDRVIAEVTYWWRRLGGESSARDLQVVGEIANRLFTIDRSIDLISESLDDEREKRRLTRGLKDAVSDFNRKVIGPSQSTIAAICESGCVVVVAGGLDKVPQLRHALDSAWASHIVTDATTAESLLASPGPVRLGSREIDNQSDSE